MAESEATHLPIAQEVKDRAIPTERLVNLLSALGNHELKALTIIAMRDGRIYTDADLKQLLLRGTGLQLQRGRLLGYCRDSLSPIGLVTRELLDPNLSVWGYQITKDGQELGMPLAGLLLQWSLQHPDFSLIQMFGATTSHFPRSDEEELTPETMKRAAETRLKVFWEIVTNPDAEINQTSIASAIGEPRSRYKHNSIVEQHLENLARNNIISYETIKPGKAFVKFKRKSDAPKEQQRPYKNYVTLSNRLYEILTERKNQFLSTEELMNVLIDKYPEYKNHVPNNLRWGVSSILKSFRNQGHIETEKFTHEKLSSVSLSGQQREAIGSLIELLDKFQKLDPETILAGRRDAEDIINNPELVRTLVVKSAEKSPSVQAGSIEDTFRRITLLLQRTPNLTASKIRTSLSSMPGGKNLSHGQIRRILNTFSDSGELAVQESKSGRLYSLALSQV